MQRPFWWLYTAHAAETAIWEAQFCKNDVTRPDGFVYPSRRHRGHTAIAISSRVLPELRDGVVRTETPLSRHPDFERLRGDRLRVAPPAADASAD
jgi:hypothetical protein